MAGTAPFYRTLGKSDHFYTTNKEERNQVISRGYKDEGIACYVYAGRISGAIPFYRYYNQNIDNHFYTTNKSEISGSQSVTKTKTKSKKTKKTGVCQKEYFKIEAGFYDTRNCNRMISNAKSHAGAWCSKSGGIDWDKTWFKCYEGDRAGKNKTLFLHIKGFIKCNTNNCD